MSRRFFLFVLVLLVTTGILFAGGQKSSGQGAAGASTSQEFKVDWYITASNFVYSGLKWGQDMVSKVIKDKTGADINYIIAPDNSNSMLTTMIASNSLPDLVTLNGLWSVSDRYLAYQLGTEGYILPYNDLIKLNPELNNVLRKDIFNWYAERDGNTYFYPDHAYSAEDPISPSGKTVSNRAILVRTDLWEAIGSPDMSTPDKFLAACRQVKDQIRTFDGKEIIPIQLFEYGNEALSIMNEYFATPTETPDGKQAYDFDMPQNKESLTFLNEAFRTGLISESNFADTREMVSEKVAAGRVFALIATSQDFINQFQALYEIDNKAVYKAIILRNHAGDDPQLTNMSGWGYRQTGIAKRTRNPEKIANLVKVFLEDETSILYNFGIEGVTYNYRPDGKIEFTQQYLNDLANGTAKQKYGVEYSVDCFMNYAIVMRLMADPTDAKLKATDQNMIKLPTMPYTYSPMYGSGKEDPSNPQKPEMTELAIRISEYRTKAIAEIITAPSAQAFNAKYDEVLRTLSSMGVDRLKAYNEQWFQAGKNAVGVKYVWPPYLK
jgi:putative aldouronate transport system substrate-binding protein